MEKLIGRLTKRKQELHELISMHRDGAKEAERCGGAMLAVENCGKLHVARQQRLRRLWDLTFPFPFFDYLISNPSPSLSG